MNEITKCKDELRENTLNTKLGEKENITQNKTKLEQEETSSENENEQEGITNKSTIELQAGQLKLELGYTEGEILACDIDFLLNADHQLKQVEFKECFKPDEDITHKLAEKIELIKWSYLGVSWEYWNAGTKSWDLHIDPDDDQLILIYEDDVPSHHIEQLISGKHSVTELILVLCNKPSSEVLCKLAERILCIKWSKDYTTFQIWNTETENWKYEQLHIDPDQPELKLDYGDSTSPLPSSHLSTLISSSHTLQHLHISGRRRPADDVIKILSEKISNIRWMHEKYDIWETWNSGQQ